MSNTRKVQESTKKLVAGNQLFKCNNSPGSNLYRLEKYKCPSWSSEKKGSFDGAGYEIDHINEWSVSKNDNIDNLQALCPQCHSFKTRKFRVDKGKDNRNNSFLINTENDDDIDNKFSPSLDGTNCKKFVCEYCYKKISSERNLQKHYEICIQKVKKELDVYKNGNVDKINNKNVEKMRNNRKNKLIEILVNENKHIKEKNKQNEILVNEKNKVIEILIHEIDRYERFEFDCVGLVDMLDVFEKFGEQAFPEKFREKNMINHVNTIRKMRKSRSQVTNIVINGLQELIPGKPHLYSCSESDSDSDFDSD
jgi:hypothetical protein